MTLWNGCADAKVAAFAEPMQLLRYRSGLTGGCADRRVSLEEFPESLISWLMSVFILSRHFVVVSLANWILNVF